MSEGGEDEYEWPSDEEKDNGDEGWILIENTFYEAEDNKKTRPKDALEQFDNVVMLEENMGDEVRFRFKALENSVIISAVIKQYDDMVNR